MAVTPKSAATASATDGSKDHNGKLQAELASFRDFQTDTLVDEILGVPRFTNEYWTARQRQGHSLHEVSYRACFKPQLPLFFIERLTSEGDSVYDPFMGRGTTLLEAALNRRVPVGCDINPLSSVLLEPRLSPPTAAEVAERLKEIPWSQQVACREDLLVFYHAETLQQICALRAYLLQRESKGTLDHVDLWIRMVAVNRLTGHSPGFFSVYTLPPNQAVSLDSQRKINKKRSQTPPLRDVAALILKKSKSLLKDYDEASAAALAAVSPHKLLLTEPSSATPQIPSGSVQLVVTSPPFLDVVDYAGDNWLRCWFCGIDVANVEITIMKGLSDWQREMNLVFKELGRVLRAGGHVAFEVGEIRGGKLNLEEAVLGSLEGSGLEPELVLVNVNPTWTKTAKIWGVDNQTKGTNSNRIVLLRKPS